MNKTIVIAGMVVLVLVGGAVFVANQNSQRAEQAKMEQEKAAMMQKENTAAEEKETMMKKQEGDKMMADKNSSRYVVYSKAAYDGASDKRRYCIFTQHGVHLVNKLMRILPQIRTKFRRMWL